VLDFGGAHTPADMDAGLVVGTAARAAPGRGDLGGYGIAGAAGRTSGSAEKRRSAGSLRPGGLAPVDQGLDAVQDRVHAEQELLPFLEARRVAAGVRGPGEPVQPRVGLLVG